ncbi:hypothetical protein [Xylanibacter ruminicola]|nr:hypothetical protein [Xylanibacter ruminicola]
MGCRTRWHLTGHKIADFEEENYVLQPETNISSREFIKKAEFVNAETFAGALVEDSGSEEDDGPTGGYTPNPGD